MQGLFNSFQHFDIFLVSHQLQQDTLEHQIAKEGTTLAENSTNSTRLSQQNKVFPILRVLCKDQTLSAALKALVAGRGGLLRQSRMQSFF